MEKDPNICDKHKFHFEMYCCEEGCDAEKAPMCPMCMCEHVQKHHVKATHIKEYVDRGLERVREGRGKLMEQQAKVQEYHDTAEDYLKTKDTVQDQLGAILERLLKLVQDQQSQATDTNRTILKCHEKTSKAIKQCEHKLKEKINDPDGIKSQVDVLVKGRNYLSALEEIDKALHDDSQLDDQEIITELGDWKKLLDDYQRQLKELDATPAQLADYKKTYDKNDELTNANSDLKRN